MQTLLQGAEEILRPGRPESAMRAKRAGLYFVACAASYGALMGTFGGLHGDRLLLVLYAAIKVPLLLIVTGAVCMPSFAVLNTLFGLREDFAEVLQALFRTQGAFAILLLALSPYTLFWYASIVDYNAAILFNGVIFGLASLAAQWFLRRLYQPLVKRNPRHRILLHVWLVLFAFVGIQTAWVLRPFIGSPDLPAQFFRAEAWGNAYVALAGKIGELLK